MTWLGQLLAEELAPRPRRLQDLDTDGDDRDGRHGPDGGMPRQSALGPYIVWLLLGQSAMMSFGTAAADLAVTAPILAASVPLAGILAESPWLMLPFIGLITAFSTYLIVTRKLGTFGLLLQVIVLDGFYGVVFAPRDFGWNDAAVFGACAISFGLIALFDNWIWPDPAEAILLESIAGSLRHNRSRFLEVTQFYLHPETGRRPDEPPATSRMSVQLDYLNRAVTEGLTEHRRAILLAAITRMERLHIQVDRLAITVREDTPRMVRTMLQPELEDVCARDCGRPGRTRPRSHGHDPHRP